MASKQSRKSYQTDLKFLAQITYATMFVWTVLSFLEILLEEGKKDEFGSTKVVGLVATKKGFIQSLMRSVRENRVFYHNKG